MAGDVHLRCHQHRKLGNFLLQLLVPLDMNGSRRKTCKNDDELVPTKTRAELASTVNVKYTEYCEREVYWYYYHYHYYHFKGAVLL